ncbi:MAG TPA: hypothetical protein VFF06_20895 [Polyangia bacterium]|nr:hypothetical protein [Polyangia bacterium]
MRAFAMLALASFAWLVAGCAERVCLSGDRRSCVCPDGHQAIQACMTNGFYDACACGGPSGDLAVEPPPDLTSATIDLASAPLDLAGADLSDFTPPDLASAAMPDLSTSGKQFGEMCMAPGSTDCAPGLFCDRFAMGTVFRCTRMCPNNVCDATCCPPPSTGTCNAKQECKFTM